MYSEIRSLSRRARSIAFALALAGQDPRVLHFDGVALTPCQGMLVLDVVGEAIACVEVLYRDVVRQKLLAALP